MVYLIALCIWVLLTTFRCFMFPVGMANDMLFPEMFPSQLMLVYGKFVLMSYPSALLTPSVGLLVYGRFS